jgi:hypothetical protein
MSGAGAEDPNARRSIRWDEAVIAEHDRDRGTRQKIDEPKTPFERVADLGMRAERWEAGPEGCGDAKGGECAAHAGAGTAAAATSRIAAEFAELEAALAEDDALAAEEAQAQSGAPGEWDAAVPGEESAQDFGAARRKHYGGMGGNIRDLLRQRPPPAAEDDDEEQEEGDDEQSRREGADAEE